MNKKQRIEELEKILLGIGNYINYNLAMPLSLSKEGAMEILKTIASQAEGKEHGSGLVRMWADIDVNALLRTARERIAELEGQSHD